MGGLKHFVLVRRRRRLNIVDMADFNPLKVEFDFFCWLFFHCFRFVLSLVLLFLMCRIQDADPWKVNWNMDFIIHYYFYRYYFIFIVNILFLLFYYFVILSFYYFIKVLSHFLSFDVFTFPHHLWLLFTSRFLSNSKLY